MAPRAGCVSPAEPASQPIQVPFVVSDYYSPDGFFGDGETRGQLELNKECPDRPAGAQRRLLHRRSTGRG